MLFLVKNPYYLEIKDEPLPLFNIDRLKNDATIVGEFYRNIESRLSSEDLKEREVARLALEKLIEDGRIHPAKIEEMVEKAKEEVAAIIKEEGERAALETGVNNLHPDIIKLIGKLKYRTSYGQNVLNHSIEVSNLARIMADELGLNSKIARRAGLLHDIGKALDHDMEGTHVELGVEVLRKFKENELVINAVEAHHGDVEPKTLEAV